MDANRQAAALDALEALVGADGVTRDPAALAPFHSGVALPLGIIAPRDTEQLAKVLAVASEAGAALQPVCRAVAGRSEEHTSELQSLMRISYAVFCLKKKNNLNKTDIHSVVENRMT